GVLLVVEREPREQPILVDEVVRHSDRVEQVVLADVLQLPCALKQEEELRLQRGRARVLVEPLEKRVFLRLLENELAPEAAREPPRETRLADADGSFHHDQTMWRRYDGFF